jgi:uncharacterized protein involved in exopolysaccharide biosynthesis
MTLFRPVRDVTGGTVPGGRNRWWMTAVLVVVLAPLIWLALTTAVMSAQQKQYTASAMLSIQFEAPTIAGRIAEVWNRDRFEIYKATQKQLLLSRFVLVAALRNPQVAKLHSIRHEQETGDPIRWLKRRLRVSFPDNAEIMEVSLTDNDPDEATLLVREVVQAYLNEIVNAETDKKRMRLAEIDRAVAEKEQEVRSSREALKKLAAELGTSTTETLTLKQKLALEELSSYRQELMKLQADVRVHQADMAGQNALLKDAGKDEQRPILREVKRLTARIAVESEQEKTLEKQVDQKQREVERFGNSTVDMDMLLSDIKNAEVVLNQLVLERDKLRVENRAGPRIQLLVQASKPEMPDE